MFICWSFASISFCFRLLTRWFQFLIPFRNVNISMYGHYLRSISLVLLNFQALRPICGWKDEHIWAFRIWAKELFRFILIAPFMEANVIFECRESYFASHSSTLLLLKEFFFNFAKVHEIHWDDELSTWRRNTNRPSEHNTRVEWVVCGKKITHSFDTQWISFLSVCRMFIQWHNANSNTCFRI